MAALVSLAGRAATSARAWIPAWGCWHADVTIDGEHALSGSVDLVIADLTLRGTVLSGGAAKGRSFYRIVAGAGGWGRLLDEKSYADDGGVKLSKIFSDAATAAGETLSGYSTTERVGPSYTRAGDKPASRVLEQFASKNWYVGEDGTTRIGQRVASTLGAAVPRTSQVDLARRSVTLAPTSLAGILPGVVVDGLSAVDVLHEADEKGIRSTIWGSHASGSSRVLEAFRAILDQLDPNRAYRGIYEYRVVLRQGSRVDLQPVRVSTGMPELLRVPVRPGVAGCEAELPLGSRVGVMFFDGEPTRYFVAGAFEDADSDAFVPDLLSLAGGSDFVALAALVSSQLSTLKSAITGAVVVANDGGASLKSTILTALSSWPGSVAASKVKAS